MDVNLLLQAEISKELIRPKDFSSDQKVEELFSYVTANELSEVVESVQAIKKIENCVSLLLTFLMSQLYLHAVNVKHVLARDR